MPRHGSKENPHNLKGLPGYNPEIEDIPSSNAQDRNVQTYRHGGRVNEGVAGQRWEKGKEKIGIPSISPPVTPSISPPVTSSISPSGRQGQPQAGMGMGIPGMYLGELPFQTPFKKGGKVNKKKGYKK